jgi:hypothetical protein
MNKHCIMSHKALTFVDNDVKTSDHINTVEPDYNDIGLCDTSPIASDILWYQLVRGC